MFRWEPSFEKWWQSFSDNKGGHRWFEEDIAYIAYNAGANDMLDLIRKDLVGVDLLKFLNLISKIVERDKK